MSNPHTLENPHPAGTPAGGSSTYQSIPQNLSWHAASRPYHAGFPATANPEYVYGPRFVVRLFLNSYYSVYPRLLQAQGNATPLYPWRIHSDVLKEVISGLTSEPDSQVVELRKERCGPNRSKVTVVFEVPDEI